MRLWSDRSGATALARRFARLSLSARFLAAATVTVFGTMILLGGWLSTTIETRLLANRAELGAVYMQTFVAPFVWEIDPSGALPKASVDKLDRLLSKVRRSSHIQALRIWSTDRTNLYSTNASLIGKHVVSDDIATAMSGKIVSQIEYTPDDEAAVPMVRTYPLFEIYTPIYGEDGKSIVAVGELYEEATSFVDEIRNAKTQTWIVVGLTSALVILVLYLIVRRGSLLITEQGNQLRQQLYAANVLADQNMKLRTQAVQDRIQASNSNELLLNQIGSDIHDGPMQLISLLILRLHSYRGALKPASAGEPTRTGGGDFDPEMLAHKALKELREISTGLVMPTLEEASLEETLRLAVVRHRQITNSDVEEVYKCLPGKASPHIKACLFRVVQEGLNNAYRYAGGADQRVSAMARRGNLVVMISDGGPGLKSDIGGKHVGLGLDGLKYRLKALGGRLEIKESAQGGTKLVAKLNMRDLH